MGLKDIPIPADIYDGQGLQALFALPTVVELDQTVTLRGDAKVTLVDAAGNAITGKHLVRVWYSTTDGGAPSDTDNTVAVHTGATSIQAITANAHYLVLTSATGEAELRATLAGAGDRFIHVEIAGKVASAKLEVAVIED